MSDERTDKYMEMVEGYLNTVSEDGLKISDLPDTFIWKQPIENMLGSFHYDHMKLPHYNGLLLSGKPGNGRHTLADAYVQSVCSREMCFDKSVLIRLRAEDFNAKQLVSLEDISSFVSAVFDICGMTGQQAFIIFDQMEHYDEIAVVCNSIADAFSGMESDKIHVICITDNEKIIPSELSRILLRVRCSNPDEELRKAYFDNNLSFHVEDWVYGSDNIRTIMLDIQDITKDQLVKMTEGFSFEMLEELIRTLKMNASGKPLGDEPNCVIGISKKTVMQYIHMFGSGLPLNQPQPQIVYMNAPFPSGTLAGAVEKKVDDQNISKLINKGDSRSFQENLELIDLVQPLENI